MNKFVKILAAMMIAGSAWAGVDINTATQSELESIKGLGPSKAKAIIAYREKKGNFKSIEELDNVKGFGKSSIAKLRDELTVGNSKSSAKQENAGK